MDEFANIEAEARKYTDENVLNPTPSDYLYAHNLMLRGFELGMKTAAGVNQTYDSLDARLNQNLDRLLEKRQK